MYLYQRIAQQLTTQIEQGTYGPGERLPSIRRLSRQHQVSIATIQQVFNLLEDQRLVEAKPKSGFYVRQISTVGVQLTEQTDTVSLPLDVNINDQATSILQRCDEAEFVDLGIAFPAPEFLPTKQLQKIISRLVKKHIRELMQVHFPPGLLKLRHQICQRLVEMGCSLTKDQIVITNGCQEALSLCLRAVAKSGDTIAIETPTFVGILQLIEALGMTALEIPTHPQQGISLEALAFALDKWQVKACALVPSFNNPLGSNMPDEKRQELVRLVEAKNIPVIEDDLFGDLHFSQQRPRPLKVFDRQGLVLYCSSVSKSVSPGLRVGWVSPGRYQRDIEHLKSFTSVSASSLAQNIVAEFMSTGGYERHLRQLRLQLAKQIQLFSYAIIQTFPKGTSITRPNGGYILWVQLPEKIDASEMFEEALKKKIGILPGHLFSASGKYKNFFRINCAIPWDDKTQQAIRELAHIAYLLMR